MIPARDRGPDAGSKICLCLIEEVLLLVLKFDVALSVFDALFVHPFELIGTEQFLLFHR